MPRKSKLTQTLIDRIVKLKKLNLNDSQICNAVGISRMTLWRWRLQGSSQKRGIARDFVEALDKAESEMYQRYVTAVQNEALEGKTVVTQKRLDHPNGGVTEEKVTRKESPNGALALKLLQTHYPDQWLSPQKIRLSWEDSLREQGHNPEEIEALIEAYLEKIGVRRY